MNKDIKNPFGLGSERNEAEIEAILKEAWDNAPEKVKEDVRKRLSAQKNQDSTLDFFNTLKENQCNELCQSGKCNADCCGCVNILESHFKLLKKLIPDNKKYYPIKIKDEGFTYIKPITENCKCVFLTDSNSCAIYNSHLRPSVCKRYGEDSKEPLFACIHINKEMEAEITEFCQTYLQRQASSGNLMASHILKSLD